MKKSVLHFSVIASCVATMLGCKSTNDSTQASTTQAEFKKPNIIFILTDDQRWDSVGYMGQKIGQTPNLDKMASEGVVFDNAFVTSAICTPSRACYMLGQFERRHGINFNSGTSMSAEAWAKSYPVILKENGYFTGYVGKNHIPIGDKGYFTGLMDQSFDYWYAGHHHIGFYPKELHAIFDNSKSDTQAEVVTDGVAAFLDPESNEAFFNNAVSFLNKRTDEKPFCLSVCFNLPHGHSVMSMKQKPTDDELYRTKYREYQNTLPLVDTYIAKKDIKTPKLPADLLLTDVRQNIYDYVDTPEEMRDYAIRTMQAVEGIDRMVGKLREQLEATGLADNTVIIYSSDHGLLNGEHGLGGKSLCYETCMKVPMMIYDPRVKGGRRSKELVQSIDVAPTILGLAGIEAPETMQGRDMMPLVRGQRIGWRQYAFGENMWSNIFGNPRCETVRSDEFRYIRYFKNENVGALERTPAHLIYSVTDEMANAYSDHITSSIKGEQPVYEELFHTAVDPSESVNLVNDPKYADVLKELRAKCVEMVAEANGNVSEKTSTYRVEDKWLKTKYRFQQD